MVINTKEGGPPFPKRNGAFRRTSNRRWRKAGTTLENKKANPLKKVSYKKSTLVVEKNGYQILLEQVPAALRALEQFILPLVVGFGFWDLNDVEFSAIRVFLKVATSAVVSLMSRKG